MKRLLVLAALLIGCANVQVTPLNPPPMGLSAKSPDQVEMFLTKAPNRPYQELYLIRSDAGDSDAALTAMRKRAAELGCDALVIAGSADRIVASPDAVGNSTLSTRDGFIGSCIVFEGGV